jgi:hypothetical protein
VNRIRPIWIVVVQHADEQWENRSAFNSLKAAETEAKNERARILKLGISPETVEVRCERITLVEEC